MTGGDEISLVHIILFLDKYIPSMPCVFLFIPEGVSVMTVIIVGVDAAPAGLVRRTPNSRELPVWFLGYYGPSALNG